MSVVDPKYISSDRPACPFYGFYVAYKPSLVFLESPHKNTCSLLDENTTCCLMKMQQKDPDWCECDLNNIEDATFLNGIMHNARIFPQEFDPGTGDWKGFTLLDWVTAFSKDN